MAIHLLQKVCAWENIKIKDCKLFKEDAYTAIYKVSAAQNSLIVKLNQHPNFTDFLLREKQGLSYIKETNTIATPEVYIYGSKDGLEYLVMEYIATKQADKDDFGEMGKRIALLHQKSSLEFGLSDDNYIGSLSQNNQMKSNWVDFFIENRIHPQLQLAKHNGLIKRDRYQKTDLLKSEVNMFLTDVKPSLLHGDLWSGNYLINEEEIPYLIDPSVYFGDALVDIAMSTLFGGFDEAFYKSYFEQNAIPNHMDERIELYQLYYLLVHLNIFGKGYYSSVNKLLTKYFDE